MERNPSPPMTSIAKATASGDSSVRTKMFEHATRRMACSMLTPVFLIGLSHSCGGQEPKADGRPDVVTKFDDREGENRARSQGVPAHSRVQGRRTGIDVPGDQGSAGAAAPGHQAGREDDRRRRARPCPASDRRPARLAMALGSAVMTPAAPSTEPDIFSRQAVCRWAAKPPVLDGKLD